jgi:hypothetical protein
VKEYYLVTKESVFESITEWIYDYAYHIKC